MNLDVNTSRFAPMLRLLSGEDEAFLIRNGLKREAAQLRSRHREIFFQFVDMLEKDFGKVHEARKASMADNWNFEALLKERFTASYCLFVMRTAGIMHWARVPQAEKIAQAYFDRVQAFIAPTPAVPVVMRAI